MTEPAHLAPGTPVAVGPRTGEDVTDVLARLRVLVGAGGAVAAGADVDLGAGHRSARVDGGAGDRRDAVLAALAVPGFGDRLGPPPALLVALFGPEATKPLGAATLETIAAGRWPVLRYAVAASDLLGPEQLVRLLELRAPEGVDPFPAGLPSIVGVHLARVLRPLSPARRLRLLVDLWEQVCAAGLERARLKRLRDSQRPQSAYEGLRARADRFEQDAVLAELRDWFGPEPTLAQAALWLPPREYWSAQAARALADALCATVLARIATTAADIGHRHALQRHSEEIAAAVARVSDEEAGEAARPVPGLTGHPARPVCYLRDLQRIPLGEPLTHERTRYVRDRLALAGDYGLLALHNARDYMILAGPYEHERGRLAREKWAATPMTEWREQVGYFSPERRPGWEGATGLVGDYFWYAELADALARLRGRPAANVVFDEYGPYRDHDEEEPADLLTPRLESVVLAAAGTAQLAELGGCVPAKPRTWSELVGGLLAGVAAAEGQPGRFAVPGPADAADGTALPGTELRIEVARTGRQLAGWAGYMGNCIAGPEYADGAAVGRQVLVALRDADERIVANVEVRLTGKGWRLGEMQARFNEDPDPELVRHTRAWVASLPLPLPAVPAEPVEAVPLPPVRRARRPVSAARLTAEVGEQLGDLAGAALRPDPLLAALIGAEPGPEALVALRRSTPATLVRGCDRLLATVPVAALWEASGHRPLSEAVAGMPAAVRDKLAPLAEDVPLPRTLRRVARLPLVAPARNAELVAIRVRAALGALLRADAPSLARAMTVRPHEGLLRAALLAVTSWGGLGPAGPVVAVTARRRVRVPGYPQTSLRDAAWQAAWPDAVVLGGDPEVFWDRVAEQGAMVPASWVGAGGWAALWGRAAR